MTADFVYGLLPDHLVLALLILLMVLEMLRLDPRWARALFAVVMLGALAVVWQQIDAGYAAEIVPGEIRVDGMTLFGKVVILACGLVLAAAFARAGDFKFWLLLASALLGALLIVNSASFVSIFLGIELVSLPAYALMVQARGRTAASEGAFKYLLMSSVGTALFLFGVSLAYGELGTLSIDTFAAAFATGGVPAASLLALSGLFLKAAVFPFHAWAPDAYASVRMPVAAVLASVVKAAMVLALLRVVGTQSLPAASVMVVAVIAIASIGFGNVAALGQRRFRRLLAYSSIAHAGYMIVPLVDTTGSRVEDLLWYVAIYALATMLACASFAALCPGGDNDGDDLHALDGKFASQPVASLLLALAVLSLAGMPPLPGFFAKLLVFKSAVASGHLVAAVLAFAGSFLGLAYYARVAAAPFRTDSGAATAPEQGSRDSVLIR